MLFREENELLCRVQRDAPMGQMMRRHWLQACLSEGVADRDGAPIADRSQERLGVSDTAVLQFRRIMVDAVRSFQSGGPVIGRGDPYIPHGSLRSFEGVVRKTEDWRTLGVSAEELAVSPISRAAE